MNEEWGPWIEHDGRAETVPVGQYARAEIAAGLRREGLVPAGAANPPPGYTSFWIWAQLPAVVQIYRVVRYQIRRPRGRVVLDRVLAQLPADRDGDPQAPRLPVREGVE